MSKETEIAAKVTKRHPSLVTTETKTNWGVIPIVMAGGVAHIDASGGAEFIKQYVIRRYRRHIPVLMPATESEWDGVTYLAALPSNAVAPVGSMVETEMGRYFSLPANEEWSAFLRITPSGFDTVRVKSGTKEVADITGSQQAFFGGGTLPTIRVSHIPLRFVSMSEGWEQSLRSLRELTDNRQYWEGAWRSGHADSALAMIRTLGSEWPGLHIENTPQNLSFARSFAVLVTRAFSKRRGI